MVVEEAELLVVAEVHHDTMTVVMEVLTEVVMIEEDMTVMVVVAEGTVVEDMMIVAMDVMVTEDMTEVMTEIEATVMMIGDVTGALHRRGDIRWSSVVSRMLLLASFEG